MGDTFFRITDHRLISAEMTTLAAERFSKSQMAVFAEDILFGISGDFLCLPIEEENPAPGVVSDDALFEIVQNPFEIVGV